TDFALAHHNLGVALLAKGRTDEAIAEYREALRINKDYAAAHNGIGTALMRKRQLDDAIAAFREALRLNPDDPEAHYNLGNALLAKGRLDEAIAEYRETLRINKDFPEAHCNLGLALQRPGNFAEGLAALRQGHELGSPNPRWSYPSAQWVRNAERLVALDAQLPTFLKGEAQPRDTADLLVLASICQQHKKLYLAAAR